MDSGLLTLGIVVCVLGLSFGVVALRVWVETKRVQSVKEIVGVLVGDPVFRRELKQALVREGVFREACESLLRGEDTSVASRKVRRKR